jgi:hypothetical protein
MHIKEIVQVFFKFNYIHTFHHSWWKVQKFYCQNVFIAIPKNNLNLQELYLIVWFSILQYLHSDFELFMCKVLVLGCFNYKIMIF